MPTDVSLMISHTQAFSDESMGLLSSRHPFALSGGADQLLSEWAFMRFSQPHLLDAIRSRGGDLRCRAEWVSWYKEHPLEMHRLWRRVYDADGNDLQPWAVVAQSGEGVDARLLGVRLSIPNIKRLLIHANLLELQVVFAGSSTHGMRRRARCSNEGLNPSMKMVGSLLSDPRECFHDIASMKIAHVTVALRRS